MGKMYSIRQDNLATIDEGILRKIVRIYMFVSKKIQIKLEQIYISDKGDVGFENITQYNDIKVIEKACAIQFDITDYELDISWFTIDGDLYE